MDEADVRVGRADDATTPTRPPMGDLGGPWLMDEEERRRLQSINRRSWGAALLGSGLALLAFGVAGTIFLLWLLGQLASAAL